MSNKILESLDYVLKFASKMIICSIDGNCKGKKPDDSEIKILKEKCDELSDAGVYEFDSNSDWETLSTQIQAFASEF